MSTSEASSSDEEGANEWLAGASTLASAADEVLLTTCTPIHQRQQALELLRMTGGFTEESNDLSCTLDALQSCIDPLVNSTADLVVEAEVTPRRISPLLAHVLGQGDEEELDELRASRTILEAWRSGVRCVGEEEWRRCKTWKHSSG